MPSYDVAEVIGHYQRKITRHGDDSSVLVYSLGRLDKLEGVSIAILQTTGVGKQVNGLKKHPDPQISKLAKDLVAKWKAIVAQEEDAETEEPEEQVRETEEQVVEEEEEKEEQQVSSEEAEEEIQQREQVHRKPTKSHETESEPETEPVKKPEKKHRDHHHHHKKSSRKEEDEERKARKEKERKKKKKKDDERHREEKNEDGEGKKKKKKSSHHSKDSDHKDHKDHKRKGDKHAPSSSSSSSSSLFPSNGSCPKSSSSSSSSQLPQGISPHYKPLPPKSSELDTNGTDKRQKGRTDDELLSDLLKFKGKRTAVYSGTKRSGYMGEIPSLFTMCIRVLQEHVESIEECGGLPYDVLGPVLERASPEALARIEECNPYLMEETGSIWKRYCEKKFPKAKREELESWREMYERCTDEQEAKLVKLADKFKGAYKMKMMSTKKTKLAYVGLNAKPPRNVMKAQARNGTASSANIKRPRPIGESSSSSSSSSRGPPSQKKAKPAPLMAKTLRMSRGMKAGFRR